MNGATRMLAVTVTGLVLVLVAGGLAVAGAQPHPVPVPDVRSLSAPDATARLKTKHLRIDVVRYTGPTSLPAGIVMKQNPQLGAQVMPGSTVRVDVVSDQVAVPDLLGGQIDHLHAALDARRLHPLVERVASTTPEGQVLQQTPAPGALVPRAEAVVHLQLSAGGSRMDS